MPSTPISHAISHYRHQPLASQPHRYEAFLKKDLASLAGAQCTEIPQCGPAAETALGKEFAHAVQVIGQVRWHSRR